MPVEVFTTHKKNNADGNLILVDRLSEMFSNSAKESGIAFSCVIIMSDYLKNTPSDQLKKDMTDCFECALKKCIAEGHFRMTMTVEDKVTISYS